MAELIGRFHPLLVHLPIGFLLLGALFLVLAGRPRYSTLDHSLPLIFLLGGVAALASCITGWLLASGGEYDATVLTRHRWLGISVTLAAAAGYAWLRRGDNRQWRWPVAGILFFLLTATGHLGGTLTHGSGYLTQPLSGGKQGAGGPVTVAGDVQQAEVYADLVGPLLTQKCAACHGAAKQKGGLRLDTSEGIRKGGKNGPILAAGNPERSELYRRLELDLLHEDHMPPKGKPQLSEAERSLLHWWISTGAGFTGQVGQHPQSGAEAVMLRSFEAAAARRTTPPDVPDEPVATARTEDLEALRSIGVTVFSVGKNSPYLSVNFVNAPHCGDAELALLLPLAQQVVWLKLGHSRISDTGMTTLGRLPHLTRLSLEHTAVTDAGLQHLLSLGNLRYLNLSGTAVSSGGLPALRQLSGLHTVVLYNSKVDPADSAALQSALPGIRLEFGGYDLPVLESDTAQVQATTK